MADTKTTYWKFFNAAGRAVGVGFVLVGAGILIYGVVQRDWLFAVPGFVIAVLGMLLMLARPYRPATKE